MSCFCVSRRHIDALVQARRLTAVPYGPLCPKMTDRELGQWLLRANADSYFARYEGRHDSAVDEMEIAAYAPGPRGTWTIVELLKAVRCYAYQSCEIRDWETSDVSAFCDALESALVTQLPGYDAAPWGID